MWLPLFAFLALLAWPLSQKRAAFLRVLREFSKRMKFIKKLLLLLKQNNLI